MKLYIFMFSIILIEKLYVLEYKYRLIYWGLIRWKQEFKREFLIGEGQHFLY